ncbi:MAG: NAD(P)H-hydrate dehydratase [Oscillospiraceae bacterium]
MVEVVSSSQMKLIEQNASDFGLTYSTMMENAGYSAFKMMLNKVGFAARNCIIFCGCGNNGGDGLVIARYAFDAGANVSIVLVGGYPKTELAIANMEKIKSLNIPVFSADFNGSAITELMYNVDIIIDAIYGTGYHGSLSDTNRELFKQINNAVAAIFSLDIPSGINGDTGECDEDCIKSDFTITFDSIKPCHIIPGSVENCGRIEVVDIGIPENARDGLYSKATIVTESIFEDLIPKRDQMGNKGTYGRMINIAGSDIYPGAAILSSMGAIASGVGYVTLLSNNNVCNAVLTHIPEATYLHLASDEYGFIKAPKLYNIMDLLEKSNSIAVGCGLGKVNELSKFIVDLIELQNNPVILDADGINALNGNINILSRAKCPLMITPHPGELARLLGCTVEAIENDRYHKASSLAQQMGIVVVLKGHNTLIASPDGEVYINCTGNSGLSKAGSGDVLTGLIGGFCAQGMEPKNAAIAAVYLHGLAGEKCSKRLSQHSMKPSDLIYDIGSIFNELENK